ncbi:MAG: class I SAM-dependent methyltransferase, partial [Bacteroidales bacterium]
MALRSTSALPPWRKKAWPFVRLFVPRRARWFYEGHPAVDGQLWYAERRLLYETARQARPACAFEVGTWKGGGSTLFIAQALHDNGEGVLHTIEFEAALAADAHRHYRAHLPHLLPYVRFHVGDYREHYRAVLEEASRVDLLLLDGAEDAAQTLAQYAFFLPYLQPASILLVHDW